MTIRDLIIVATSRLKSARIPEPRLEAESLLAHLLKRDLAWMLAHADALVSKERAKTYAALISKRTRHVPFAQIVGEKGFYGRVFNVTKDVLIPRPETELLIEAVLSAVAASGMPPRIPVGMRGGVTGAAAETATILDVGTGSGAIGLTLAAELPKTRAILCDISAKALSVAKQNARRMKLTRRISFKKIDILKNRSLDFTRDDKRNIILVANLPYLPLATWQAAQPEVRAHEPKLALVSGKDGLDHYRALFKNLVRWKRLPALLALEAEPGQFEELSRLVRNTIPDARIEILKDLHGDARVLLARAA